MQACDVKARNNLKFFWIIIKIHPNSPSVVYQTFICVSGSWPLRNCSLFLGVDALMSAESIWSYQHLHFVENILTVVLSILSSRSFITLHRAIHKTIHLFMVPLQTFSYFFLLHFVSLLVFALSPLCTRYLR